MNKIKFNTLLAQCYEWKSLQPKTRQCYSQWFDRYIKYLQTKQTTVSPQTKITEFLMAYQDTAPGTKRQAVSALRWMYKHILKKDIRPIRIQKSYALPDLLTKQEIAFELAKLPVKYQLLGWLFAGSGISLAEALALRHKKIHKGAYINCEERKFYIPLHQAAKQLYATLPNKISKDLIFTSRKQKDRPLAMNAFSAQCRRCGVDPRITPSTLRANFILAALEIHGVAWVKQATGLSKARLNQYLAMTPKTVKSPLDT